MFKKHKTQEPAEATLRRVRFGGLHKDDVERVVAGLNEELAQSEATNRVLNERVSAAEATLEAFDASLRHMGTIVSLAEEHARRIEADAKAEAERIRDEADAYSRSVADDVELLLARKQEALDSIATLLESLSEVTTSNPEPEAPAEPELEPVAELVPMPTPSQPPAVTVADLIAMQPDLGF